MNIVLLRDIITDVMFDVLTDVVSENPPEEEIE